MADTNSITSRETLPGDLAEFLNEVKTEHALSARGRLIFALDATMSRQKTWDLAANLTTGIICVPPASQPIFVIIFTRRSASETQPEAWHSFSPRK
jgi:hypothetical protein